MPCHTDHIERLLFCMGSLMFRQVSTICECLITLVTLKDFSPVWVLLCYVRLPDSVKASSHWSDSLVLFSTVSVLVLSHCPAYHGQFSHTASAFWGAVWDSWPPIGRMERSKGPTLHHPLHCCGPENTCGLWANALKTYNKSLCTPLY